MARRFTEWLNAHHGYFYTIDRTIYRGSTAYQEIELVETSEFGRVLLLDGITQVVEKNEWQYHEPLVHYPLVAHPDPKSVLIIGGGDGGALREVLRHPVSRVDFVELDKEVVEFSRKHLAEINAGALEDPRVNLRFQDGRAWVEDRPGEYDVIIMDMTDPFGPSAMLYTAEFFGHVRAALRDQRGLFSMHAESPIARPVAFRCINQTLGSAFPVVRNAFTFIQMYATYWAFAVASPATDIGTVSGVQAVERIAARGCASSRPLQMISAATWESMQVAHPYIAHADSTSAGPQPRIISDADPRFPDDFSRPVD